MEAIWGNNDFDAAIQSLRFKPNDKIEGYKTGYLLFSFELEKPIIFYGIEICKTIRVNHLSRFNSYISEVKIPNWILFTKDLFLNALSAVLSFCFSRFVRPSFSSGNYRLNSDYDSKKIGIQYIIEFHSERMDIEEQELGSKRFERLIMNLNRLKLKDYLKVMGSIRLIYLNFHSKSMDINLAYTLVVGSIDNLASKYILRTDVSIKNESLELSHEESLIKKYCDENNLINWFNEKILHHTKLKVKFVEFVLRNAPFDSWFELKAKYEKLSKPPIGYEHFFEMSQFTEEYTKAQRFKDRDYHPHDLSLLDLKTLLGNTYNYRSNYIHNGQGNSILNRRNSRNRFFDWSVDISDNNNTKEILTINYPCLVLISKISILTFVENQLVRYNC